LFANWAGIIREFVLALPFASGRWMQAVALAFSSGTWNPVAWSHWLFVLHFVRIILEPFSA
jgi:ABC-type uncharacterized transport system YnjBCD permease subunit